MSRNYSARIFLTLCLFALSFMGAPSAMAAQCVFTLYNEVQSSDGSKIPAVQQAMSVNSTMNIYFNSRQVAPLTCASNPPPGKLMCNPGAGSIADPTLTVNIGGVITLVDTDYIHQINKNCYTPAAAAGIAVVAAAPKPAAIVAPAPKPAAIVAPALKPAAIIAAAQPVLGLGGKPTVKSISPNSGRLTGGISVTITGTNFTGATAVHFGSTPGTNVSVRSANMIVVTNPGGAGTVDVTVTTPDGTSAKSTPDQFTYIAVPIVTAISPDTGKLAGGTPVTITGTHFKDASAVFFGSVRASNVKVVSPTEVTATSPAGSLGSVDITVTTPGGTSATSTSDQFTYVVPAPTITSIAPNSGKVVGGKVVTINGANFTGATAVKFGSTAASSFTVNSATKITATSPAGTGVVDVTVTTDGGTSANSTSDHFTYDPLPTVTVLSPTTGWTTGGQTVIVTGTNLTGATAVRFGGAAATHFTVNSASRITATNPAGSGTVDVTVETPNGISTTSSADHFTYAVPAPTITALSPSFGQVAGGGMVTITGTNFSGATDVFFGGVAASSFSIASSTSIIATSPGGSGTVDVTVTTPHGRSALSAADKFTYVPAPAVTALSTSSGTSKGGTTVTITGNHFDNAIGVLFNNAPASHFTVNSATRITATTPAGSGMVDVKVMTAAGTSAMTSDDRFTYVQVPTVTGLSVDSGTAAGGTGTTITGTNFTNATAVSFGNTPAARYTIVSPTLILTTSPVGSGTVDVTVATAAGTSAKGNSDKFTFIPVPTVKSLSLNSGKVVGGATVTITGTNFTNATYVAFGGVTAEYTVNSATSITATSPASSSGIVDVTVTTPGGISAAGAADKFTYLPVPAVTAISPISGTSRGGTTVTITGANFNSAINVSFGNVAASSFTIVSSTRITATSPAGSAGAVDVRITTPNGTSAASTADKFTYLPAPTVTDLSRISGTTAGGETVTITGTHFTNVTAVNFGGTPATHFTVNSATSITATTPASPTGADTVDITVVTAHAGTSATSSLDQFTFVPTSPGVTLPVTTTGGPMGI